MNMFLKVCKQGRFIVGNPKNILKMSSVAEGLLSKICECEEVSTNKVTVVGVGQVGMACAFSILSQQIASDIALVDVAAGPAADNVIGEMMDLQHGSAFLKNSNISGGTDLALTADSRICIVAAGVRQRTGESRLDLVQRNTDIFKEVIPKLVEHSPNTILLIVSNPVDILTYVAWKLSGLPQNRVIGAGTSLDSSRLRFLISQRLGVATTSCHAWVIGEHGDSSVPVWSGVNIAGVRLRELNPNVGEENDPEKWLDLHKEVVNSAYEVIRLKGYTSWAIGLTVASLVFGILNNTKNIHAVSALVNGQHGIDKEVYLSLPCVLTSNGVSRIIKQTLTKSEREKLQKSANLMHQVQTNLKY